MAITFLRYAYRLRQLRPVLRPGRCGARTPWLVGRRCCSLACASSTAIGGTKISEAARRVRMRAAYLNVVLLHGEGPVDAMQLEVEATRVAHGIARRVASPQGRGARLAIRATQPTPPRRRLQRAKRPPVNSHARHR